MLNIGLNYDSREKSFGVTATPYSYPVYFEKRNICIHCGAENTLKFVDKFGRETSKDIYPFENIKCTACKTVYSIMWKPDEGGKKMHPCATDKSIIREFVNAFNTKGLKEVGDKTI